MFLRAELADANVFYGLVERRALETLAQPLAQQGEMLAAEQALQSRVDLVVHAGANRRSGSASEVFSRPSQVHRDTNTASMPSRRCNWQMATPGSSA